MNVKDIIKQWLMDHDYDGLWNEEECGCSLDDLMPCNDVCIHCEPAYKRADGLMYREKGKA